MFEVTHRDAAAPPLRLAAVGDLDVFAASNLREAVRRLMSERTDHVVLDLSGVTWVNASGLRHLAQTRSALTAAGVPVTVSRPSAPVTTMSRRAQLTGAWGRGLRDGGQSDASAPDRSVR